MWQASAVLFFAYVVLLALLLPELQRSRRRNACLLAALGLAAAGTAWSTERLLLRDWVLPPAVLLASYWSTGQLYRGPLLRLERTLMAVDTALRVRSVAARLPRLAAELLELAYACVYPLVPIALGIHILLTPAADPARFWAVVLITDFICFGMLPWMPTRPPRALEPVPWRARLRPLNVSFLGRASIGANTLPSGHAAEALAVTLLVTGAPLPVMLTVAGLAAAISAAALLGRYHYAVDIVAGWGVALLVWAAIWR